MNMNVYVFKANKYSERFKHFELNYEMLNKTGSSDLSLPILMNSTQNNYTENISLFFF